MITLRIDNTVHDFDAWKEAFDRYEEFRRGGGVRSYRIARLADEPNRVLVDLDFDDSGAAGAFRTALEKVWASPVSRAQLADHREPAFLDVVVQRTL